MDFKMKAEKYIDDIPFDTDEIASAKLCEIALNKTFDLEEEPYIDDIPLDTSEVVSNTNAKEDLTTMF
ncbi:MAG: hypothetical protein GXO88_12330 [Chlorobi bacterium]|nr:hypothetical protein [Chlorobiota bacterium]